VGSGLRWTDDVELTLKKYGCEKMENRNFGQNRMGMCNEGRYGRIIIIIIIIIMFR
jgi:hypothetical protein